MKPGLSREVLVRALGRVVAPGVPEPDCRLSAVLMPFFDAGDGMRALFILRPDSVSFGRQIAFPGGKVEASDRNDEETAFREVEEEIGVLPGAFEGVRKLGHFPTRTSHYDVAAHAGFWVSPEPCRPCDREVASVFSVKVMDLVELHRKLPRVQVGPRGWPEVGPEYEVSGFATAYPVVGGSKDELPELPVLWGVTARIVYVFLSALLRE